MRGIVTHKGQKRLHVNGCLQCGGVFFSRRRGAKFCSGKCRQKNYRKRQRYARKRHRQLCEKHNLPVPLTLYQKQKLLYNI